MAEALFKREDELENVTILSTNSRHRFSFLNHPGQKAFRISAFYFGPVEREAAEQGIADFAPLHLSRIDRWCFETGRPDVNFFEVSPPDEDGYFSYGCTGNTSHTYHICSDDSCRDCYERKTKRCSGGCMGFKINRIPDCCASVR